MQLDKLGLYVRTASHLRTSQLAHTIYRHFLPRSRPHVARDQVKVRQREALTVAPILSNRALGGSSSLTFVGYEKSIAGGIDWHSADMPRLWRYHLHYFDYLNDASRSDWWKRYTIRDWIAKNPNPTNDAWEAYPLSLRIVNWVKFFETLSAETIDDAWVRSLYEQALWLEHNLERRVLANHYLKNAKALVFAGTYFEGRDADRWRRNGIRIMVSQMREQFLGDGGHYERSPMYHMICVEDLLDTLSLLGTADRVATRATIDMLEHKATAGLAFLDAIIMPDGEIPLFNDAAFGVGPAPNDLFRYGRALVGYKRAKSTNALSATALESSGYYVIRDGDDMLIVDCGLPGPPYQPGHGHSDCLSYELALAGERIVTDTGVRDYDASTTRRYARSTAAHNTVTVDAQDQSEMWDVFRIARRARPLSSSLRKTSPTEAYFTGAHDGFARFRNRIIHRRTVNHRDRYWSFEDCIDGHGSHRIESRIHFAPGLVPRYGDGSIRLEGPDGRVRARILAAPGVVVQIADSPYFPRFGVTEMRSVITMTLDAVLPARLAYTIEKVELTPPGSGAASREQQSPLRPAEEASAGLKGRSAPVSG